MKKIALLIVTLLTALPALTQNQDFASIVEAERKSASKLQNFQANINTANYNVVKQRLEVTVNPTLYSVSGKVTTHYIAKQNMSTLTFDMATQLTASSVTRNGVPLSFAQNSNKELVITLPAVQAQNVLDSITVTYSGVPPTTDGAFNIGTHNGSPMLWTLSEPYGAKDWWPCKQDLNDKIENLDVYITAPSQYVSVANGLQKSVVTTGSNKTTHFKHTYPIPAYLVAIAVSNYSVFTQTGGTAPNTFPIVNYIYPETASSTQTSLAQTLPIMSLFEELFEAYPFKNEKYGHAQCGIAGGMEHTTVSFMGSFGRELIAHELAHQWFGDKITCGTWKDIWLNEGFATYLSGLVVEDFDGATAFTNWKNSLTNNITSSTGGAVYLSDTDTTNINRIFSSRLSYNKGAMVVHMLRYKLGDALFYQGIKNYLADPELAYGYAKTADLQAHLELVYGQSLSEFFNDWVYKQGYPTYTVSAQYFSPGVYRITINQTQSHSSVTYFEMPVPIRLTGSGGQFLDVKLENTFNGQQFMVSVPFTVTGVTFDRLKDIVSRNNTATLGAPAVEILKDIRLYPNPTKGELNISLPTGVIAQSATFYNALGQKVMEAKGTQWNVSGLSAGVHFITLVTDKGTTQLEFVKE
ncbi:MAG: M1 family aminopeptidase [Flavobacterium sp.]